MTLWRTAMALAALCGVLLLWPVWQGDGSHRQALRAKLASVVAVDGMRPVACAEWTAVQPMVILALGQSNAGNHGTPGAPASPPVPLIAQGLCALAADPLPGSTGTGGSIWLRLSHQLSVQSPQRRWVFSVMGIDATSIGDWTDRRSPLRERLLQHLHSLHALGLAPQLVLWQHGEADARLGTSSQDYGAGLDQLAAILEQAGTPAPILLAQSTVCRSRPDARIRSAVESRAQHHGRFLPGPDTDTLVGTDLRHDGCHFSAEGLERAAALWAQSITAVLSPPLQDF